MIRQATHGANRQRNKELNMSKKWGSIQSEGREKVAESPINNLRITYESPKIYRKKLGKDIDMYRYLQYMYRNL